MARLTTKSSLCLALTTLAQPLGVPSSLSRTWSNPSRAGKEAAMLLYLSLMLLLPAASEAFRARTPHLPSRSMTLGRSRGLVLATASSPPPVHGKPRLYAYHRSRSKIVEWYMQELGVDYELAPVAMDQKEHKSMEFLKINPFGKLPVLEMEDGQPLMESGAILMYVADKYDPKVQTAEARAVANSWCMFANASLGPAIFVEELRQRQMADLFGVLDGQLKRQPFLLGADISVADIAVGSYLAYIPRFFPQIKLDAYPSLKAYVDRLAQRPAFKATVGAPPPAEQ